MWLLGALRTKLGQWALIGLLVLGAAYALIMYGRKDERSKRALKDLTAYAAGRRRMDNADLSTGDETVDDAYLRDAASKLRDRRK